MHVVRGLLQAIVMVVAGLLGALVAAGGWSAVTDGGFRVPFALALMVVGGLVGLVGGTVVARAESNDVLAFLGRGPDRAETGLGENLGNLGVFLFVSLPLFAAGLALYGTG